MSNSTDIMAQAKATKILKQAVPWLSSAASTNYRRNYKGTRGRIGIVGGARDYAGAPYFASISTMRLGADLAYVICSQGASSSIKNYSPDLIVMPVLDCPEESEFVKEMECLLSRLHALVIGPGLGRENLLQKRAMKLIIEAKTRSIPLVLDADGLSLVNENPSIIKCYPKAILTPNRIELQRMLNTIYSPEKFELRTMKPEEIKFLTSRCAKDLGVTILAKGQQDYLCDNISTEALCIDGDSGSDRRCGGQGDILSGLAGVFLHWIHQANESANEVEKIDRPTSYAAFLAALLTRKANELAFKEFGQGALASHMVDKVQKALDSFISDPTKPSRPIDSRIQYEGKLTQDEIKRYARQMIMDEFGPERQLKLKGSSAIIIGAGGLGCPSAAYLGASGIGRLGIVDDDIVEESNLHRQILHDVRKVGILKTESIKESILSLNPNVKVETHPVRLNRQNAVELIERYDVVIDASDNMATRYMISDACVIAKKPLIFGAALKMDGQLTVLNYGDESPCYRCILPNPPPADSVGSCSDNGVLGVVTGVIGVQQALEAIKIASGLEPAYAGKMLIFDGQLGSFRTVTLNGKRANCVSCGKNSKITRALIDYEEFCGTKKCDVQVSSILRSDERLSVEEYLDLVTRGERHVLVDVRPKVHSEISKFKAALAIPMAQILHDPDITRQKIVTELDAKKTNLIVVVCRKGIASQKGVRAIQDIFDGCGRDDLVVKDIIGGMTSWASRIDPSYSCV